MTGASTAVAPSPPSPARPWGGGDDRRPLGTSRIGWVWAAAWLIYLFVPIRKAWDALPSVAAVVALVALLVFAAEFVTFFIVMRRRRLAGGRLPDRVVWGQIVLMLALLVVATPGAGEEVIAGAVYVGVTAAMSLPLRQALAAVGALAIGAFVLPRVLPGWEPLDSFVPQLLLAAFAAFGVSQVLQRNIQLAHAREQLVDLAVAQERERLARDVHDILGHSLTVITVKSELASRLMETLPAGPAVDRARAEVGDVERLAREALADVRATVTGQREVSLTGELAAARQALAAAGIEADLPTAVDDVPTRSRELFAWTLREGVTNVVRHSGARWCGVRLTTDCVEVRDDGHGAVGEGGGSGLAGLRRRAESAGATLVTGRAPEGGFLLRVVAADGGAAA